MKDLINERLGLLNTIKSGLNDLTEADLEKLEERLLKQFILDEYVPPKQTKEFSNVSEMKKANLSLNDIAITNGYYISGDGGEATYIIKDYNYYLNEWLPVDCRKVGYKYNKLGTDLMLIDTPVDEYGNHTLNNGLVACLLNREDIKAEQYGAKGDGKFDNSEVFIHLFAHMKKGKITFKKDAIYLMPQRTKDNIPDIYTTVVNPYAPYMCGRSSGCQRPIMANIDGVELTGENSTLKIKDNDWNTVGTADFALLNLFRVIRNLKVHGLIFDNNGLTMDYTNSVENHGIAWKQGNTMIDSGKAPTVEDGTVHEISNIEIYNCEFKNGGTTRQVNDCGGDGILIINPMENSHDINIHNNKFTNWGRWCFAIDLGGNGECIENVKFNDNECIQYENNINSAGNFRGLGWIDFEARKCFRNLEVCRNYVKGCNGWAFNGNDKISENVTITDNTIIRNFYGLSSAGVYPYMFEFYYANIKNLLLKDNDLSKCQAGSRLGLSLNNAIIEGNKLPSTKSILTIRRPVGNIVIDGNEANDSGIIVAFSYYSYPSYFNDEDIKNDNTSIKFTNNKGGVKGCFISKASINRKIDLIIENNIMGNCDVSYFNSEWKFNPKQISINNPAFSARGATFIDLAPYNYRNYPNGGGIWIKGDVVSEKSTMRTICTKSGYLTMQGSFSYCESDGYFTANASKAALFLFIANNNLYVTLTSGTFGETSPTHTNGIELNGNIEVLFLKELASIESTTI